MLVKPERIFGRVREWQGRAQYRITEPLITFYEAIMRRRWSELEVYRAESVRGSSRPASCRWAGPSGARP
ncbi:hypothetical protein Psi01_31670 [Planobispora siamensis]|uniref:Uncharacterized protein n=2 Tax=Planobispora siamensis TaxID=936338 RepID=A0A8J3WLG5_9ACTN|nr:hypothetical protein Psi01_31670 [Planobispora siamensis]